MAPAQRRRPRSDSQDSDSLLPADAAPPLRCPPTPPSARHRRIEPPDTSAVTVHKAQGTSLAFFQAIFGEKELALGCTYAFNRPVWNRPQGPHDAQALHRAFIVRSSSKFDAGSIATLRTARGACPAHDAPRAAELDGAIAADVAELTLAQAALKLRIGPQEAGFARCGARCTVTLPATVATLVSIRDMWWYYGTCVCHSRVFVPV